MTGPPERTRVASLGAGQRQGQCPAEVLSERIWRKNGIRQLLTNPHSPATAATAAAWPALTTIGGELPAS